MGELDNPDPSRLRISDAERQQVAELLRLAAGEGRIDFEELDERLELAFAAKTYADLVPLTADLPSGAVPDVPGAPRSPAVPTGSSVVVAGPERSSSLAIMGGVDKRGVWVVPKSYTVMCLMGGANLDLREARFAAQEVTITINAIMGGADIVVNRYTHVIVDGLGIMGSFTGPGPDPRVQLNEHSPVVRVRGVALMGGVNVRRKAMPAEDRRPGWRHRH